MFVPFSIQDLYPGNEIIFLHHGVNLLKSSTPVLKPLVDKNEIKIIGAYYDLGSGKVLFDK